MNIKLQIKKTIPTLNCYRSTIDLEKNVYKF